MAGDHQDRQKQHSGELVRIVRDVTRRYPLFGSPNRFGLPAFYTLHVWAWKSNPTGAFVNWHSDVSCENYSATEK